MALTPMVITCLLYTSQQPSQQKADGPGSTVRPFPGHPDLVRFFHKELPLEKVDDRRQQIGNQGAVENGLHGRQEFGAKSERGLAAKERVVKQQNSADRQKDRQTQFKIAALLFHHPPSLQVSFYTGNLGIAILILP